MNYLKKRNQNTDTEVVNIIPSTNEIKAEITKERVRLFRLIRHTGPGAIACAAGLYFIIVDQAGLAPDVLGWWTFGMLLLTVPMYLSYVVESLERWVSREGVPILALVAHTMLGIGWGALLWLDLDASQVDEFRWITLSVCFAMSGGVAAGLATMPIMASTILVPMWLGCASALLAMGELATSAACMIYAAIIFKDMLKSGQWWTELITLRIQSHQIAEAYEWAATHDAMTKLLNRNSFMHRISERLKESDNTIRLLFIDLDHFKKVNDRFGHAAGDHVLIEATERMRKLTRSNDVIGRLGGDEFCILFTATRDDFDGNKLAQRIIDCLEKPFSGPWGVADVYISASIGIASIIPGQNTLKHLFLNADNALYEAKRTGRGRVVHFSQGLNI